MYFQQPLDLNSHFPNVILLPQILGIFPFSYVNGTFQISIIRVSYNLSFIIFFILIMTLGAMKDMQSFTIEKSLTFQLTLIATLERFLMSMCIVLFFYSVIWKGRAFQSIRRGFSKVDKIFEKLNIKIIALSPYKIYFKCLYFWPWAIIVVTYVERLIRQPPGIFFDYLESFAHIICNLNIYGIGWNFSIIAEILGIYLKRLNQMLIRRKNLTSENLYLISEAHDTLIEITHITEFLFAPTLLVLVVNCFIKSTDNFYKIIQGESFYWSMLYTVWIMTMVMQLAMLVASVNTPVSQVIHQFYNSF